jgi:serine/threonine-protein kinase
MVTANRQWRRVMSKLVPRACALVAILAFVAAGAPAVPVATPPPSEEQAALPPSPSGEPPPSSAPLATTPAVVQVVVPDLALSTLADAVRALTDAGLEVGEFSVVESDRAADTVLASTPAAGARTAEGSVVSLTVASGFNRVPQVVGLSRAEALVALQNAGFTVAIGTTRTAGVAAGTVVGTDPGQGVSLALTTTVTLLEAEAPPRPTSSPPPPTGTPTTTPEPGV